MEFRTKLLQPHRIKSITSPAALLLKDHVSGFDNYFLEAPTDVDETPSISKRLLWHLSGAFLNTGWNEGSLKPFKEDTVRWVFDPLGSYFHSVFGERERHAFRCDWQLKLIVSAEFQNTKYRYTPRSDFHVSVDRLMHLLVEVQSEKSEGDRYRMLLQAACAARLGRQIHDKPFIVVALYIENSGTVTRYFVFQPDGVDPTVFYDSDVQDWNKPFELFAAIFEIYNLVSIIQSDRPLLGSIQERTGLLSSDLSKHFEETFMSKETHDYDTGEDVYYDRQVVDAFTRAGYTLVSNDEDENGWAPLIQLKPTMRHAIQSNGTAIVVKLLHPDTNELQFLQHVHRINRPDNHTIPLLETLNMNMGTFICVPEATPLDIGFRLGMFHDDIVDFSRQLIEGVRFLHRHGIAHLDIKPQNIVALPDQLFIIDFDISVRVSGPNALIDRWCGTPGWMAPEIGLQHGPRCSYSPIRADLWSCGLVLRYLALEGGVEENPFEALARRLLNKKPQNRPLLHPSQSSFTGQHRLKRRADALPHGAKRLAICAVHP